jgi:putative oxidoreductase
MVDATISGGNQSMSLDRVSKYWPQTLSIVRILIGLIFLEHGTTKLLGYPPPLNPAPAIGAWLWIQGVIEFVGGLLLTTGLFTRLVALVLVGVMGVAYFVEYAPKSFFPLLNGGEAEILYCLVFLLFFVAGPGPWSIDKLPSRRATE